MKPVIEATRLGKMYKLGQRRHQVSIRESLSFKRFYTGESKRKTDFWALRDVSFSVNAGETLGIIGPNGAGKSTLLKILSRVIEPTEGQAILRGRVSSLLEVGTGFHPELTGRENVYFNGSLLGMSRKEIEDKFEQISDFSELGKFIESPVKYYSSGMRVRLGFSVAAHLDAEIMIVDEALAVGDAAFKKKSLEKMRESASSGRTVIFVSHSMQQIEMLCDRSIHLEDGKVLMVDETSKVIDNYIKKNEQRYHTIWKPDQNTDYNFKELDLEHLAIKVKNQTPKLGVVKNQKDIVIEVGVNIKQHPNRLSIGFNLIDDQGRTVFRSSTADLTNHDNIKLVEGPNKFKVTLDQPHLKSGQYYISLSAALDGNQWLVNPAASEAKIGFELDDGKHDFDNIHIGLVRSDLTWEKS